MAEARAYNTPDDVWEGEWPEHMEEQFVWVEAEPGVFRRISVEAFVTLVEDEMMLKLEDEGEEIEPGLHRPSPTRAQRVADAVLAAEETLALHEADELARIRRPSGSDYWEGAWPDSMQAQLVWVEFRIGIFKRINLDEYATLIEEELVEDLFSEPPEEDEEGEDIPWEEYIARRLESEA